MESKGILAGMPPTRRLGSRAKAIAKTHAKRRIWVDTRERWRVSSGSQSGGRATSASGTCTSGHVAQSMVRWIRAKLARIHSGPIHRTVHARATVRHVEVDRRRPGRRRHGANVKGFGPLAASRGTTPYPQLRFMSLVENGTLGYVHTREALGRKTTAAAGQRRRPPATGSSKALAK